MKVVIVVMALGAMLIGPRAALALGEYNGPIQDACAGHSTEMVVSQDILNGSTIAMHPYPDLGRRITFMSGQRWICKMHKGSMMFGSTVDGWGGVYRIMPEINEDGVVIILSPTVSPKPSE